MPSVYTLEDFEHFNNDLIFITDTTTSPFSFLCQLRSVIIRDIAKEYEGIMLKQTQVDFDSFDKIDKIKKLLGVEYTGDVVKKIELLIKEPNDSALTKIGEILGVDDNVVGKIKQYLVENGYVLNSVDQLANIERNERISIEIKKLIDTEKHELDLKKIIELINKENNFMVLEEIRKLVKTGNGYNDLIKNIIEEGDAKDILGSIDRLMKIEEDPIYEQDEIISTEIKNITRMKDDVVNLHKIRKLVNVEDVGDILNEVTKLSTAETENMLLGGVLKIASPKSVTDILNEIERKKMHSKTLTAIKKYLKMSDDDAVLVKIKAIRNVKYNDTTLKEIKKLTCENEGNKITSKLRDSIKTCSGVLHGIDKLSHIGRELVKTKNEIQVMDKIRNCIGLKDTDNILNKIKCLLKVEEDIDVLTMIRELVNADRILVKIKNTLEAKDEIEQCDALSKIICRIKRLMEMERVDCLNDILENIEQSNNLDDITRSLEKEKKVLDEIMMFKLEPYNDDLRQFVYLLRDKDGKDDDDLKRLLRANEDTTLLARIEELVNTEECIKTLQSILPLIKESGDVSNIKTLARKKKDTNVLVNIRETVKKSSDIILDEIRQWLEVHIEEEKSLDIDVSRMMKTIAEKYFNDVGRTVDDLVRDLVDKERRDESIIGNGVGDCSIHTLKLASSIYNNTEVDYKKCFDGIKEEVTKGNFLKARDDMYLVTGEVRKDALERHMVILDKKKSCVIDIRFDENEAKPISHIVQHLKNNEVYTIIDKIITIYSYSTYDNMNEYENIKQRWLTIFFGPSTPVKHRRLTCTYKSTTGPTTKIEDSEEYRSRVWVLKTHQKLLDMMDMGPKLDQDELINLIKNLICDERVDEQYILA